MWGSYILGGHYSRRVHVILLDIRSGMDPNAGSGSEAQVRAQLQCFVGHSPPTFRALLFCYLRRMCWGLRSGPG